MEIKMIAVDLDGTLFRDDKTVSDRTVATLKKCREKGIKVVYATARGQGADALVSRDVFDGFVRMNGAVAYAEDTLIHRKLISTTTAKKFLLTADSARIQIAVEIDGWSYSNFDFPQEWGTIFTNSYEIIDFSTLDAEIEKIWAMPRSESEIDILKSHLPQGLYLITTRDDYFTMVLHEEAKKSNAIEALAKHWNICTSQIVAFGDDVNDLDMLKHCGIGVAMGNAVDEVKNVADYICDTNENDGIAKWLEERI